MSHHVEWCESAKEHEKNEHYRNIMCLKPTNTGPRAPGHASPQGVTCLSGRTGLKKLCILPKAHSGPCCGNLHSIFKPNQITDKIKRKIDLSIYTTPGNDDYVFKNRSSRLFAYAIDDIQEKQIRDKKVKKKYCIPVKDATTPTLMAAAAVDWYTFITNVEEIKHSHLKNNDTVKIILQMLEKNKIFLTAFYNPRRIFNDDGNTMCVVTGKKVEITDIADIERDNRVNIMPTDIQMGHNECRSNKYPSIRGCNLVPMSRRGNLMIGEHSFTEDGWLNELLRVVNRHMKLPPP